MTALIEARDLWLKLGTQSVLRGVDLTLGAGEIVTIVGPNGSGKSTLLRTLLGALRPDRGLVTRAKGLRIGYIPQRLALDATLPLNVARFLALPKSRGRAATAAALARVDLAGFERRPLAGLSGGQMQRVLLARALLEAPQAILMDEPTQGLDQPGEAAFYRLLQEVRTETGAAVLMVSHDLHVVMAASDRVVCLNGHVCCEGAPAVVSNAPEYRALFGEGTQGALALYRHHHNHDGCDHA
ncbi:metal ABC transporter ATP-binding protein [Falsirhodobacter sp. alg1]|uniref:ATP-binding cassette domain-containing protein n=1 Tax=Falsirhodobacter sp. alg1 TaxID=1472418 RepID=UPI000786C57E|nr:metal ABC transporter ATP-binding protein [Falsirhodobacter sp. alg1]